MLTKILFIVILGSVRGQLAKDEYFMDRQEDCILAGDLEIQDNRATVLKGRTIGQSSTVLKCLLKFRAVSTNAQLEISFRSYDLNDCDVKLIVFAKGAEVETVTHTCSDPMPGPTVATAGEASIKMDRRNYDDTDYNYEIVVRAFKPDQSFTDGSTDVNIPIIAGSVAGGIVFFIIVAIICVCCYKKRYKRGSMEDGEVKMNLDEDQQNRSYGYSNEMVRNGNVSNEFDSPRSQKKLLPAKGKNHPGKTYPSEEKNKPLIDAEQTKAKSSVFNFDNPVDPNERSVDRPKTAKRNERSVDRPTKLPENPQQSSSGESSQSSKSPLLDALHNNPKFRKSFSTNEEDADKRANRISGYLSEGSQSSVPESPPPPPLPKAHKVPKSPKPLRHHASIKRAYRQSSSIEDMNLSPEEYDDKHIKLIQDSEPPSPSEVVPIKLLDPESKPKHTLRPNRGKGNSTESKKQEETIEKEIEPPRNQGAFQRNNSLSRKSKKSPRLGRSSRGSAGHDLDDWDSVSRPGTPTSIVSRSRRDEDSESYAPLRRSDSRQSLYASRSSLYGRRGKRRSSFSESVSTYARDDLDASMYDFDDGIRMSRRGYDRGFRSMGDIVDRETREMREKETQTLRETATQTGKGQAVVAQPKKYVRNQSMRKASASSTTGNKAKDAALKAKQSGTKQKEKTVKETETKKPATTETETDLPLTPKVKPKTKPKPKPVPRKSTKSTTQDDQEEPKEITPTENLAAETETPMVQPINPQQMMQPQFVPPGMVVGPGGVLMQPYYPPGSPVPQGYYTVQPGMMPMYPNNPQNIQAAQHPTLPHHNTIARQHVASPVPPGYPPTSAPEKKQSKSSWDLLCNIADQEKQKLPSMMDSASVTGSVFSSAVPQQVTNPSIVGYNPQSYNMGYMPGASGNYQQTLPTGYNNPQVEFVPSLHGRFTPVAASSGHYSPSPGSEHGRRSPSVQLQSPIPNASGESKKPTLQRKDSWGLLKELAEQNQPASHTKSKQESIV